jgi:MFS family permease
LDNGRGPASPAILKHFQISKTQLSYLFALPSLFSIIATATASFWLSRLGAVKATYLGFVLHALSGLMIYFFIDMNQYNGVLLAAIIFGVVQSIFGITMNLLVVQSTTPENRKRFLSGLHSIYGMLAFTSPLIFGFFALRNAWPSFFLFSSFITVLCLAVSVGAGKKLPKIEKKNRVPLKAPVNKSWRLIYGISLSTYVASEVVVSSQMVVYLTGHQGLSAEVARYYLSGFFACLTFGRILFFFVDIPFKNTHFLMGSIITSFLFFVLGVSVHPVFLSLQALPMAGFFPLFADLMGQRFPRGIDFMMSSINLAIGVTLGSMQFLFGQIAEVFGFGGAYWLAPICGLISLGFIAYFLNDEEKMEKHRRPS